MNENYKNFPWKNFDGKGSVDVVKNWPYELFPANMSEIREKQMKKILEWLEKKKLFRETTSLFIQKKNCID